LLASLLFHHFEDYRPHILSIYYYS